MPRLIAALVFVAAFVAVALWLIRSAGTLWETARSRAAQAGFHRHDLGETPMQRLSFVLLCTLIFYAALWGGA